MKLLCKYPACLAPLSAMLSIVLLAGTVAADDWPLVRGDLHGTGVARSPLPDAPEVLWKYRAAEGAGFDATAVVADGIIYIGDTSGIFHAVRLTDGTPVWTKGFDESSFAAGAAVETDRIYVGDLNGVVRCLAAADGEEQWSTKLDGEVYAGPTLHDGKLLVVSESGSLSCLHTDDGREVWPPFKIDAPLRCSPTVAAGHVMLAGCDSLLHVVNATDGIQTSSVEIDGPTGSTPAMHGNRVFFGTESGTFFGIDVPNDNQRRPSVAWTFRDPRRGQPIRSAAAVTDDIVVFGTQGKAIYALDPQNGHEKWNLPTRSRVESSPVVAGQHVAAATTAGKIYLLDATTGESKWEYDAGGGFTASPVVVDRRLVLGNTGGTLYCFGARSEKSSPDVAAPPNQ